MTESSLDLPSIWKSVLAELQLSVSTATFQTMFAPTHLHEINNGLAKISCNNSFLQQQIETKYYNLIKQSLDQRTNQNLNLIFIVQPTEKTPINDLPLFQTPDPRSATPDLHAHLQKANLQPQFTFDTFAVGSTNQLAFAAAEAVAKNPGHAYNPLFIWGGTGVGKSHLMQAIGHTILSQHPDHKILFCPGEDFTNEIISAIRNKTTLKFKDKYRKINALLLDDIQFLAGKDTAQEEFFHTFNAIQHAGGQIILTCDRPPSELTRLEDRLRSRFQAGLIVDIGQPDFELRTAILLIKSKQQGFDLDMSLAQQVAEQITTARELEGFLMQLKAAITQNHRPPDEQVIGDLLGKSIQKQASFRRGLRPADILKATAEHFDLKINQLKGPRRQAHLVQARHIAIYILRHDLNLQQEAIGELLNRDHTTILHAVEKIHNQLGKSPELSEHIMGIRESLR